METRYRAHKCIRISDRKVPTFLSPGTTVLRFPGTGNPGTIRYWLNTIKDKSLIEPLKLYLVHNLVCNLQKWDTLLAYVTLGLFIYFLEISKILNISWNFEKFSMKFFSSNFPRNFKIFRIFPRNFEEIFEIFSRKISPNFSLKKYWNFEFFYISKKFRGNFEIFSRHFRKYLEKISNLSRNFKKTRNFKIFSRKNSAKFSSKKSWKSPRNFEENFEKSWNFEENSRKKFSSKIFRNFKKNSRFSKFREKKWKGLLPIYHVDSRILSLLNCLHPSSWSSLVSSISCTAWANSDLRVSLKIGVWSVFFCSCSHALTSEHPWLSGNTIVAQEWPLCPTLRLNVMPCSCKSRSWVPQV